MKYPTIILGAGASHDYFTTAEENEVAMLFDGRPFPVTNDICAPKYLTYLKDAVLGDIDLGGIVNQQFFSEMKKIFFSAEKFILPIVATLNRSEKSLEKHLSEIWKTAIANNNTTRKRQLVAFAYYLQFLFYFLSKDFGVKHKMTNNYLELANNISDFLHTDTEAEVLVVNFNYDLLMDIALGDTVDIDERVNDRMHHLKVHGSCDRCWVAEQSTKKDSSPRSKTLNLQGKFVMNYADDDFDGFFDSSGPDYSLVEIKELRDVDDSFVIRPSLLLPFYLKDEYGFPCSASDLDKMKAHLNVTDGILVIGWSANDSALLNIMKESVKQDIPLAVVAVDNEEIAVVRKRFSNVAIDDTLHFDCKKFTPFSISDKCKEFFKLKK